MRAEQKARTESLAIASIYSLQKNARSKVLQRMWRAYAAKHCLKRLKKQRQKAKKLRRKFFKRQGRWVMKAWRGTCTGTYAVCPHYYQGLSALHRADLCSSVKESAENGHVQSCDGTGKKVSEDLYSHHGRVAHLCETVFRGASV